jgi:hypothetical protein
MTGEGAAERKIAPEPVASPNPAAFHLGPAHVIVFGNPAFVAAYGGETLGQPAREAMVDLPSAAFALMDMVLREGRPLALRIRVSGAERRLLVVPRKEVDTGETYGVATYLRPAPPDH